MRHKIFLFLLIIMSFYSCTNYYNKAINWADEIPNETNIEIVKKNQPNFVKINWDKPLIIEEQKLYEIEIEGNNDVLNMKNFLVFVDGKYQGRESKK